MEGKRSFVPSLERESLAETRDREIWNEEKVSNEFRSEEIAEFRAAIFQGCARKLALNSRGDWRRKRGQLIAYWPLLTRVDTADLRWINIPSRRGSSGYLHGVRPHQVEKLPRNSFALQSLPSRTRLRISSPSPSSHTRPPIKYTATAQSFDIFRALSEFELLRLDNYFNADWGKFHSKNFSNHARNRAAVERIDLLKL